MAFIFCLFFGTFRLLLVWGRRRVSKARPDRAHKATLHDTRETKYQQNTSNSKHSTGLFSMGLMAPELGGMPPVCSNVSASLKKYSASNSVYDTAKIWISQRWCDDKTPKECMERFLNATYTFQLLRGCVTPFLSCWSQDQWLAGRFGP